MTHFHSADLDYITDRRTEGIAANLLKVGVKRRSTNKCVDLAEVDLAEVDLAEVDLAEVGLDEVDLAEDDLAISLLRRPLLALSPPAPHTVQLRIRTLRLDRHEHDHVAAAVGVRDR